MIDFRAARARLVMQRYAFHTGLAPNDPAVIRDAAIDLAHYCDRHGLVLPDILKEALAIDHLERNHAPRDAGFAETAITFKDAKAS